MGNTYVVKVWAKMEAGGYEYVRKYMGESFIKSVWHLLANKLSGKYGCVVLEWR